MTGYSTRTRRRSPRGIDRIRVRSLSAEALQDGEIPIFDIRKTAFDSAEKSPFKFPRRVDEALEMMEKSHDYIRNRSRSGQGLNYVDAFRKFSDTVFEVANKETKATMEAFGEDRVFEGVEMQPHIKIGNREAADRTIRIHFIFDKKTEKFAIGHCGRHLPTAGMKK